MAVGALGLLLGIPLALVGLLQWERMERANTVIEEVAQRAGRAQSLRGPQLVVPYTYPERVRHETQDGSRVNVVERSGTLFISPARLEVEVNQTTRLLHRAIYEVPVQTSDLTFVAKFDGIRVPKLPDGAAIAWADARWRIGVADPRGLGRLEITRTTAGPVEFEPSGARGYTYASMSAPASVDGPNHDIELRGRLVLTGVGSMSFAPAGVHTRVSVRSDWPHPSFHGEFVPGDRNISDDGFTASWQISNFASGVPEVSVDENHVNGGSFGVRLMNPSDGYTQVGRSLKYGLLFVVLALGAFLVLELSSKIPVHPAQYALIGLVQISFYLLLLALSEHTSVAGAYAIAGTATTVLTGVYALWTFGSARFAASIFVTIGVSYGFQYTLVRLEDHALLVGAIIVFVGLAVLMYATRAVQWYRTPPLDPESQAVFDSLERGAPRPPKTDGR